MVNENCPHVWMCSMNISFKCHHYFLRCLHSFQRPSCLMLFHFLTFHSSFLTLRLSFSIIAQHSFLVRKMLLLFLKATGVWKWISSQITECSSLSIQKCCSVGFASESLSIWGNCLRASSHWQVTHLIAVVLSDDLRVWMSHLRFNTTNVILVLSNSATYFYEANLRMGRKTPS